MRLRRIDGQTFLPSFGESLLLKTSEFTGFLVILLTVLFEEFIPFLFVFRALGSGLMIEIINFIGNNKCSLRIKATIR